MATETVSIIEVPIPDVQSEKRGSIGSLFSSGSEDEVAVEPESNAQPEEKAPTEQQDTREHHGGHHHRHHHSERTHRHSQNSHHSHSRSSHRRHDSLQPPSLPSSPSEKASAKSPSKNERHRSHSRALSETGSANKGSQLFVSARQELEWLRGRRAKLDALVEVKSPASGGVGGSPSRKPLGNTPVQSKHLARSSTATPAGKRVDGSAKGSSVRGSTQSPLLSSPSPKSQKGSSSQRSSSAVASSNNSKSAAGLKSSAAQLDIPSKSDASKTPRKSGSSRASGGSLQPGDQEIPLSSQEQTELEELQSWWTSDEHGRHRHRHHHGHHHHHKHHDDGDNSSNPSTKLRKSMAHSIARSQSRGSYYDPHEVFKKYTSRLEEVEKHGGKPRKLSLAQPMPPRSLFFERVDFENLGLDIYDRIFSDPAGCRILGTVLFEPTKSQVKEHLKKSHLVYEKIIAACMKEDPASATNNMDRLKKEMWDVVRRCEIICFQQNSFFDESSIRKKFDEMKRTAETWDFDGCFFAAVEQAIANRKEAMEQDRQMKLKADMQLFSRDMPKFKMVVHTMGYLPAELMEQEFESEDSSTVTCQYHTVAGAAEGDETAEADVGQHRFLALKVGVTSVVDPRSGDRWQVKIITEDEAEQERALHRRIALEEARKQASWWGQQPEPQPDVAVKTVKGGHGEQVVTPRWGQKRLRKQVAEKNAEKQEEDVVAKTKRQTWRKHVQRRESVERLDLFDIINPLIAEESCGQAEEFWCLDALDYCFYTGRSPDKWNGPKTPLRSCIAHNRLDVVNMLLKSMADPDESNDKGVSVLHLAVWHGHLDICRTLLLYQADPNIEDQEGSTPFFFVSSGPACALLFEARAYLDVQNGKGQTPLHFACRAASEDVLTWMGRHSTKSLRNQRDDFGALASYYAYQAGMDQRYLVRVGVKTAH